MVAIQLSLRSKLNYSNWMKFLLFIISFLFSLFFLVSFCVAESERGTVIDAIVASIDGEPITLVELRRHASAQGYVEAANLGTDSAASRKLLEDLIVTRLLEREAQETGISVGEDEINAYMDEIKRQNKVNDAEFRKLLKSRDLTWDEYVAQIRNDILKSRVVGSRIRAKINVVNEDIERYLEENPDLIPPKGSVRLLQIRIPFRGQDGVQGQGGALAKEQANEIRQKIFSDDKQAVVVFAKYGGMFFEDLGHLELNDLRAEISNVVSSLEVGAVSETVEIDQAVYLFLQAGKITAEQPVDEVMKKQIEEQIFKTKFQEELKDFLDEDLLNKYHVEFAS